MDREEWINACAERFMRHWLSPYVARDFAITEFNIRCRDEPMDTAPELPADRWPDPADAAVTAMYEYAAQADESRTQSHTGGSGES